MKPSRYVPAEDITSVTIAVRETDEHLVVTMDGLVTSCPYEQAALDAHELVRAAPLKAAGKNETKGIQS